MIQITSTSEKLAKKNIINRISDVPGGVSVVLSTLVVGNVVAEGTPLSAPTNGKRTVCKQAKVLAGPSTTEIPVEAGTHHFKVGDFVGSIVGGKAYAITEIPTANGIDTITVGTAIDLPVEGAFIYEMAAEAAADTSALKNTPDAILKEAFEVPSAAQVIYVVDAFLRADVVQSCIGSVYLALLKGILEVKY